MFCSPTFRSGMLLIGVLAIVGKLSAADRASTPPGNRQGLERAWATQVQLDTARNEVQSIALLDNHLVAITSTGVVQLLDAQTGATQWITRVGNPLYPCSGPALNQQHEVIAGGATKLTQQMAVINGSTVFVLDLADGHEVLHHRLGGAPAGAPALSAEHVFVPLLSGRVEAFPFANLDRNRPWNYTSAGRVFQSLSRAGDSVVWSTERGYLYNVAGNASEVRYRFESTAPFVSPVAYQSPNIYAATVNGYLYALEAAQGNQVWRYSSGAEVEHPPMVVGERVYLATDEPALHCLSTAGQLQWIAPGVSQFLSAGTGRVYATGKLGALLTLDTESGAVIAQSANQGDFRAVANDQTDWLYVYTNSGFVQCFREAGSVAPQRHSKAMAVESATQPPSEKPEADFAESGADEPTEEEPATEEDSSPFDEEDSEAPAEEAPAEEPAPEGDDPFGGDPFATEG